MKDYCIQLAKAEGEQIGWKAPPLFCLLVRYLACIVAHDVTSCTDISFIIEPHFGFCGRKAPPPGGGTIFWLQIYPFQAISSNFGFCGRKAPPPGWGEIFWLQIYPFQAISSNFGFCAEKPPPPPPRMSKNFLTLDLSISGNFKQLWFLWQKSPSPPLPQDEWKFFDFGSIHFRQYWATLVFVAESPPPQVEGNFFDFRSIHFRQFWATLVFVAEKPPPPQGRGKLFWLQIYPFQAISRNFGFCGRKAPPMSENFWLQIYPFQAISSNFGFCGRKAPPPRMRGNFLTSDLSISGNFEQLWFLWQKSPPQDEGNFFDFRSIHFRQFWANLVFVAEKPPPRMSENFLTLDLSISGNFKQLWFLWQKSPPPPPGCGKIFWLQIYPFQAISSNFGFCGRKAPPPQDVGKFFDFISIHFRQFQATLVFVAEKPPKDFHPLWKTICQ